MEHFIVVAVEMLVAIIKIIKQINFRGRTNFIENFNCKQTINNCLFIIIIIIVAMVVADIVDNY